MFVCFGVCFLMSVCVGCLCMVFACGVYLRVLFGVVVGLGLWVCLLVVFVDGFWWRFVGGLGGCWVWGLVGLVGLVGWVLFVLF